VGNRTSLGVMHGLWTLECVFRGNVGIHRAPKAIQVDGSRPRRVSLPGFPCSSLSGTLASYGASAVARTSGRGHVAEANHCSSKCSGVLIRVSPCGGSPEY